MRKMNRVMYVLAATVMLAMLSSVYGEPGADSNGSESSRQAGVTSLSPLVTETGAVSLSVDGLGTNDVAGGIIQVEKPAGATVRSAFMAAASRGFSGRILVDGDVKIDGQDVIWTESIPAIIGISNHWADVTSLVKTKIDNAPTGRVDFNITEVAPPGIDGELLAVIFDDPNQTTSNTVVLLFGAQSTTEDMFAIGLAQPLNLSDPNLILEMSLGISFSEQISSFTQASVIKVDSIFVSSSAGGEDDGSNLNGALFTVGGLDDSSSNPVDPMGTPNGDPRQDDELYDLTPFATNNSTSIIVTTSNASSDDDNILFASFFLTVTAVVGEGIVLSPSSGTNPVGTTHTVTASIQDDNGVPVVGRTVTFSVLTGPNMGDGSSSATDAVGQASFTYTGDGGVGMDEIQASFVNSQSNIQFSNIVTKTWESVAPVGACCNNVVGFTPCTVTDQNDCEMNLVGTYLGDASDCSLSPCSAPNPPAVLPSQAGFTKDRFISFDPSTNGALPIAFRATRVGSATPWYVSCALRNDKGAEGHFSRLIPVPEFCDWSSITQLHVHGCEVVPGNEYVVVATEDDSLFSGPLSIFTTSPQFNAGRQFGDLVGNLIGMWTAPEGQNTTNDIVAVIQKLTLNPDAPLLARVDIAGQVVDETVSIIDVLRVFAGFNGDPFGFGVTDCLTGTCIPDCALFQATGKCCFLIGESGAGCVDGVRFDECDAMPAPRNYEDGAFCTGNVLADCPAPISPTIDLIPISSTGSSVINGNEITISAGGVVVELELHLSNWGSVGDGLISAVQAQIDGSSYCSGLGVPLNPLGYPGAPVISCPQGNGCPADGSTCNTGAFVVTKRCTVGQVMPPTGAPCDSASCPVGESCEFAPASLLIPTISDLLTFISFPGLDYSFAVASTAGAVVDSGTNSYFGTLLVDVPAGADGTYTIDLINDKILTFIQDGSDTIFPIGTINPALILVGDPADPTGACCTDAVGFTPCAVTDQNDCEMNLAGVYQGDATTCEQFPCSCDVNNNTIPDVEECACAQCDLMPPGALDQIATGGAFKIVFLDGTTQEILGLTDPSSAFGRSDPFSEGDVADDGATIVGGGLAPFAGTAAITRDPCVFPPNFPENGDCGQEIHVEILSLDLTNGTQVIKAGQAFFDSEPGLYQNSIGEAQGECIDLPADIFFNVFFELNLGAPPKLYNKTPVVLRARLQDLPIDLDDPGEDFINDPSFPAVALFDAAGIHRAYLVSVSFGDDQLANLPPTSCQSQRGISTTISFDVDSQSNGAVIDAQPNHVSDDAGQQIQQVTVYRSGDQPGEGPDNGNVRYDDLIGQIGGIGGFNASDVINSLSYGRDGTLDPLGANPVLLFSVDRPSRGKMCTDVRIESDQVQVAADIFIAQMNAFGLYTSPLSPVCVGERGSCLVLDQTSLGLRPANNGFGHDNMTALEISEYDPMADFAYLSFTGPTFQNDPTDEAKIWIYAPPPMPLQPGSLNVFASHASMGLQAGDVIDAIAVSDATPGIDVTLDPQMPNGVLDVGLDQVLFSLTTSSPTVTGGGHSGADIFRSSFDGSFSVHATADALGLLSTDEVDAIDVSPGFGQNDCNRNGIDDQCEIDLAAARGENIDINNSGIPDECETRNRYVMFAPENVGPVVQNVAYEISMSVGPGDTGVLGWVGPPDADGISLVLPKGTLFAQAMRSTWEPVIDIGDCEIVPAAIYGIRSTADGMSFTPPNNKSPHKVRTILKPSPRAWGDAVGVLDAASGVWTIPDGLVTANDIVAVVQKFQLVPSAPHFTRMDLVGEVPNRIINGADILEFVRAFESQPYPHKDPADCP